MNLTDKIYIAGHRGMVGSALVRRLKDYNLVIKEVDLMNQKEVNNFFEQEKPDYVFLVAGKVGGIKANNTLRAEFIYNNLMIAANVIHASYKNEAKKLLYVGSSCIYPAKSPQPIKEDYLLTGSLEETNRPYAVAKISGIEMCQAYRDQYGCNFIAVMPTNSYGPGDNYDLENSHVLPALIRKFITAKEKGEKEVEIWGTGKAMREFIHVDDMADALVFLMNNYDDREIINIGTGEEYSILQLANMIKYFTKYEGGIKFNGELDGMMRKSLDSLKLYDLGWKHKIHIDTGILETIKQLYGDNIQESW